MSVSVIIVNFNSGPLLAECLKHLDRQTLPPERVWVVDNASSDGSADIRYPPDRVTVLKIGENIGFAAGNNLALARCATPWVALLNPDAFPAQDWLETLVAAAGEHPGYAMFGSRLICADDPGRLDGDGDCYHVSGVVWRDGHGRPWAPGQEPWEIFSPCAAAALYRTEVLRRVGGFDEDFFCYLEDVDLGFRLRLMGHRCLQVPAARVRHVGSATTGGRRGEFAVYHGHRNLVWTFFKNMPSPLFGLFLPLHITANLLSLILGMARGQGRVMLKAKGDALRGLRVFWRKRQIVQKKRKASAFQIFRVLNKRGPGPMRAIELLRIADKPLDEEYLRRQSRI
jgi:GT2 family glycosyltransferase